MESRTTNVLLAMMMLAVILMVWTRATNAALEVVEQAYEINATQVERWPLSDDDRIVLRPCDACDQVTLSVTSGTRYRASNSSMNITREELLQIKSLLRNLESSYVYVFYRPDDGVATRIVLDAGN